jgi:putative phosphoribosyl transferase
VVCLLRPEEFWAIGQFYEDFTQVEDEEVVRLLREFAPSRRQRSPAADPKEASAEAVRTVD